MTDYEKRCAEACQWCAQGRMIFKDNVPCHRDELSRYLGECTAPTKEQYIEELVKEIARLEGDSLVAYLRRQWEWSKRTFGEGKRTGGVTKHIRKELDEIAEDPNDFCEWIDVAILALDGYWRHGGRLEDIQRLLQEKQDKNFARQWPIPTSEDEAVEHVGGANHRIQLLEEERDSLKPQVEKQDKEIRFLRASLDLAIDAVNNFATQDPKRMMITTLELLRDEVVKACGTEESLVKIRATVGHFTFAALKAETKIEQQQQEIEALRQATSEMLTELYQHKCPVTGPCFTCQAVQRFCAAMEGKS